MATELDELITKLSYEDNSQALVEAEKRVTNLSKSNEQAAKTTDDLSAEQLKLAEQLQQSKERADKLKDEQNALRVAMKKAGGGTKEQREQLKKLGLEFEANALKTKKLKTESAKLGIEKRKLSQKTTKQVKDLRKLQAATKRATAATRKQAAGFKKLGDRVKSTALGLVVRDIGQEIIQVMVQAAAAVAALVPNFVAVGDALGKTRKALGVTSDDLQRLRFAGARSGVEIEAMDKSLSKLTKGLEDARTKGTGPVADAFETLNLKVADFDNLGTEERVNRIADAMGKLPNDVQRSAIAMTLFGAKNKEMANFLAEGSEGIERLGDRAFELGGIIDTRAISSAEELADQFLDLETFGDGLVNSLGAGLVPLVSKMSESILDWVTANRELIDSGIVAVTEALGRVFETLGDSVGSMPIEAVTQSLISLVEIIGFLVEKVVASSTGSSDLTVVLAEMLSHVLRVASAVVKLIARLDGLQGESEGLPGPFKLITMALGLLAKAVGLVVVVIEKILEILTPFIDTLGELFAMLPSLSGMFDDVKNVVLGLTIGVDSLNSSLSLTTKIAGDAIDAVNKLKNAQKAENQSDAELQRRVQEGTAAERKGAEAEIRRRVAKRESGEATSGGTRSAARDKALKKFETNIKKQSSDSLKALTRDGSVSEKLRNKATKELERRRKKGGKAAAAERKNLLTSKIASQIDKLAQEAGERAAARAILRRTRRGIATDQTAVNQFQRDERDKVKKRLTANFAKTGELPAGIRSDISQLAKTPGIEAAGGRVAPPVISITNNRFETMINIETNVESSATAQQIAAANVTAFRGLTNRDVGDAIRNSSTQERR